MTRLQAELQRLFLPHGSTAPEMGADLAPSLQAQGYTRAVVVSVARPADWDSLLRVWQGVQVDAELPAPAIAVNGVDGYQLWFSLQQAVPVAVAAAFAEALRATYLTDLARSRWASWPTTSSQDACGALRVPAQWADERWSAFVSPDLARIFANDPWLDMAPADASQADVLAGLGSVRPDVFEAALARWSVVARFDGCTDATPILPQVAPAAWGAHATPPAHDDPAAFLHRVMNDPSVPMPLRIDAAKALLHRPRPGA